MALRQRGQTIEPRREIVMLGGLYQSEMAFGQRQRCVARDRAEDGNREPQSRDRISHQGAMSFGPDAVEDHAGNAHRRIVGRKAAQHGCG